MTTAARRIPRIAVTPGEPAGIGPDLCIAVAQRRWPFQLVAVADPELLERRARQLQRGLTLTRFDPDAPVSPHTPGHLPVAPVTLYARERPGTPDTANARYVLETLDSACDRCLDGTLDALVTGPVHKAVINEAGIHFSGHTEHLARRTGVPQVVMMLTAPGIRVALATTHLPLRAVADAITADGLAATLRILHDALRLRYGLERPRILVCGLNPHAGEGGHLGVEERDVIEPVLGRLRRDGLDLQGPLPADTTFAPRRLALGDAVLAMYHDQGLPVLKHAGFGHGVNVTLGLPIVRTSVDHGTALSLAGSGRAEADSLTAALAEAARLVTPAHDPHDARRAPATPTA